MKLLKHILLAAATLAPLTSAMAEDIDLFTNTPPGLGNQPNVLFIVDNTANWNQAFKDEMAALTATFQNLPLNPDGTARYRVGVLFAAETSSSDSNSDGGYVRAAIRPMDEGNKKLYATMIDSLDRLTDKGNGGASSLVMTEAYRYFTGGVPVGGTGKAKADWKGNTGSDWSPSVTDPESVAAMKAVYGLGDNALNEKAGRLYNSPVISSCARNYIIYISNGPSQDSNSVLADANRYLKEAGGVTTQIPLSPNGSQTNVSDEWARFMKQSDLDVTTYTIDVDPGKTGQGPGWTEVLQSMATVSEGTYTAVVSGDGGISISNAINKALSEIQAVNTVFASVSLPVSVNTQGTFLNQVYIGMFRPDANAFPRWSGNLKQYRLDLAAGTLRLEDADGNPGVNSLTGFISECARSFWTPGSADNYWLFKPMGECLPPTGSAADLYKNSNFPDGSVVEKGGQGFLLRSAVSRNLKTCSSPFSTCATLKSFNKANGDLTAAVLGVDATSRDSLIDWAYGLDMDDEDNDSNRSNEWRPSIHGDVVHSRPVAINLGSDASPKVVVFYGSNDGSFRAINGNRSAAIGATPAGGEFWSFMPPEFLPKLDRLRTNKQQISYPNITASDALPKDYGIDGTVSAYQGDGNAWIYASMRRGGRSLYAFNVNPKDPTDITIKWKVGCPINFSRDGSTNDAGCTTGFDGIGQTWSLPKIFRSVGYGGGTKPMLIMGGGYDICEDRDPSTCSSTKGNRVYVLDADTGALLKTFTTERAVPADVAIAQDLITELAQFGYVADTGGNLYRITMLEKSPEDWEMIKIADLGCDTTANCSAHRKFLFAPDITAVGGGFNLLIGTGDREKPLRYGGTTVTNSVANYFFNVRDVPSNPDILAKEAANCGSEVLCLNSLLPIVGSADPAAADLAKKQGWYLGLNTSEKVVTAAITIFGTVTFSTHEPSIPDVKACSNDLGTSRVYNVGFSDASPPDDSDNRFEVLPEVGLPPSPVAGLVTLDDGKTVAFCIGCSKLSPLEAREPEVPSKALPQIPKSRVYWYTEQ